MKTKKQSILDNIRKKLVEIPFINLSNSFGEEYCQGYDDGINVALNLIKPFIECLQEVSIEPYSNSDHKSLLETLQKRAQKVLSAYEDGKN